MTDWIDAERDVVFQNYGRQPIVLEPTPDTRPTPMHPAT